MLFSILIICLISFGGLALTYLVTDEESFMWRLAAGNVIGSAILGLTGFLLASIFGLNAVTVLAAMAITLLPLVLLRQKQRRNKFLNDWAKAKGKLQGGNLKRFAGFGFYAFFLLVFWLFFGQTIYSTDQGIFTGGSQNLGDLPFHLGAIFSFTDGGNFPPQNPSFAGARFSYPFIADFVTACYMKLGVDVKAAMIVQNVAWAFSLLVILERFAAKLTGSKLAGRIAPFLLFFSGGLGFVWFFKDFWEQGKGIWEFLWSLPRDYTIGDQFRWGNSMVVLFMTQRSLLLGMPLAVLVLGYLWKIFESENVEKGKSEKAEVDSATRNFFTFSHFHFSTFAVGLLAGMLPLIHLHSLMALFVVTGFCFLMKPAKWREWLAFGAGVCVIAVPELVWSMAGSASETTKFIGWHFGWDKRDANLLWFWFKNTGFVIPVIAAGVYVIYSIQSRGNDAETQGHGDTEKKKIVASLRLRVTASYFYIPFAFLFVVSNVVKFAPWEWDNIKILIYWFVGSLPLMAYAIAWIWQRGGLLRAAAGVLFVVLTLSGALDVWRTATGQVKSKVFDTDAVRLAEQIKGKTPQNALFLNAPTYNSAVVLSGRRSFMRYSGHLSSHGIDYAQREDETRRIYEGGGVADLFLRENNIEYVLVSPEERNSLRANEEFFRKYPVIAESGQYRVYKIK